MTGQAIVTKLKNLQSIEGADKIVQATIFGETIIVSKDHKEGELGLLFDMETQLSHEFCNGNNLYRRSELNVDKTKSGYFDDNRRVRPIRLKGVRCSGFWMPISSLMFTCSGDKLEYVKLQEGLQLNEWNGISICNKYIPPAKTQGKIGSKSKEGRISKKDLVPTFKEHFSTEHFARNLHTIKEGDLVIITEKLHGTSVRCGNLPVVQQLNWWKKLLNYPKIKYNFVVGSRKTVKSVEGLEVNNNHYYNEDLYTEVANRELKGKLEKGECIYGEIVGYLLTGNPIMGSHSNEKLKPFMDKKEYNEFIARYGNQTVFSYGCIPLIDATIFNGKVNYNPNNKLYVYRITRQNEDGESIDLSWEQVKQRCEVLGVAHVPEIEKRLILFPEHKEDFIDCVNKLTEADSKHFPQHLNEGVCVRIENGSLTPTVLKSKRYFFRILEGNIKEQSIEDEN